MGVHLGEDRVPFHMWSALWPCVARSPMCLMTGKSMYCSEVHGGAGPGFRPASAHYIAEQV